jgi:hypothetical protein
VKHNLIAVSAHSDPLITDNLYHLKKQECLLRLSAARYLSSVKADDELSYSVLK